MIVLILLTSAPLNGFVGMKWPELKLPDFSGWFSNTASAAEEKYVDGYYTYTVIDNKATIVSVDKSINGNITTPITLGSYPVTQIKKSAFYGCKAITSIVISEGISYIGDDAFRECKSLSEVTIPSTLTDTDICGDLFTACRNLKKVSFSAGTKEVLSCMFSYLPSLQEVIIPEGVTRIGSSAFKDCYSLINIDLPDSITSIGSYAFANCTALKGVALPEGLVNLGDNCFSNCYAIEEIVIPSTVVGVELSTPLYSDDSGPFSGCSNLTKVVFTEGTEVIPSWICHNMTELTEIDIPHTVNSIGEGAFSGCIKLEKINLPSNLISIGAKAFQNCVLLKEISLHEGITNIYNAAFENCDSLTEVTIPSTIKYSKNQSGYFPSCENLSKIKISEGSANIVAYLCKNMNSLSEIIIPNSVTVIGVSSFENCENLEYIEMPNELTKIEDYAFNNCIKLKTIELPNSLLSLGKKCFSNCDSITEISIPSSLCEAGNYKYSSFKDCDSIYKVDFSEGTTKIADGICAYLPALTEIVIPKSVVEIGAHSFYNCVKLEDITLHEGLKTLQNGCFANCTSLENITIPSTIKNAGGYSYNEEEKLSVFEGCDNLVKITFREGITSIPANIGRKITSLKEIVLPEGVTHIGYNAFKDATSIEIISLPTSLVEISSNAFYNCKSLKSIELHEGITDLDYGAFGCCESIEEIVIPTTLKNTDTRHGPFAGCKNLVKVTFKEGARIIPRSICEGMYNLSDVIIPEGVLQISQNAFMDAHSLININLPESLVVIHENAFENCLSLKSIDFHDSLTHIGRYAFRNCDSLTEVELPKSLIYAGEFFDGSFSDCDNLTTVIFEEGITKIPELTCNEMSALTRVIIPESVTTIGRKAFNDCERLDSINLSNVTNYEENAFRNCISLKEVNLSSDVEKLYANTFVGCENIKLIIPNIHDSTAIQLINNSYDFSVSSYKKKDSTILVPEESNLILTTSLSTNTEIVSLKIEYEYCGPVEHSKNKYVNVKIPNNYSLVENSLTCNKNNVSYTSSKGFLKIYPSEDKGIIRISFKRNNKNSTIFQTYAQLLCKNYDKVGIIGVISAHVGNYSLGIPQKINGNIITIDGYIEPVLTADLYLDGSFIKTIKPFATGRIVDEIFIESPEKRDYTVSIKYESKSDGIVEISESTQWIEKLPVEIEEIYLYHGSIVYDFLKKSNLTITHHSNATYTFKVKPNDSSEINTLYIVNNYLGNIQKYQAKYDSESYSYYAVLPKGTILGEVSVEVSLKKSNEEIVAGIFETEVFSDFTYNEIENTYSNVNGKYKVQVGNSLNNYTATVTFYNRTKKSVATTFNLRGTSRMEEAKLIWSQNEYGDIVLSMFEGEDSIIDIEIDDLVDNGPLKDYFNKIFLCEAFGDKGRIFYEQLGEVKDLYGKAEALDKQKYLKEYEAATEDLNISIKALGFFAGIQNYSYTHVVPNTLEAILTKGFNTIFSYADEKLKVCNYYYNKIFSSKSTCISCGCYKCICDELKDSEEQKWNLFKKKPKVIIDPSGYIYEAVASNRIKNAITTLYCIPFDESDENFWVKPDVSKSILWDATEYEQNNPISTDEYGQYAWDVPIGWWQVKCEKEGYETTYSEWLPVPPPQLDVNIGLITTRKPNVEFINVYNNYFEVKFDQYMDIETINNDNIKFYQNSSELQGVWEAIDKEVSVTDSNIYYAKTFKFNLSEIISGKVDVNISNVENYAGLSLDDQYINNFEVDIPITGIELPDLFETTYGNTDSFTIKVLPAEASKNKIVNISLSNDYVVDCAKTVQLDQNGEAVIVLNSLLPGEVVITYSIEDTIISDDVRIVSNINENEPEKKYSITWLVDGEETVNQYSVGDFIIIPNTPFKQGFIFNGWSANIPQTMPEEDLTFEAMFIECEHSFVDWEIVSPATCTETGEKVKSCACGINITDIIPATNHNGTLVQVDAKAPTCKERGYDAYEYCTVCDYTTYEEIPAFGHTGGKATCKEKAQCEICDTYYGSLAYHSYSASTCTASKICTVCGATSGSKLGHKETVVKGKVATYTAAGLTDGKKCSVCGTVTVTQKNIARKKLSKVKSLKTKAVKLATGSKTTLTLSWNKVVGAEKYEVQQYIGKKWKTIKTVSKTPYTVTKLKANKFYKFRVRAVAGKYCGSWSSTYKCKTVPLKTTIEIKTGKNLFATLWSKVANVTGYEVQYSTSKKFTEKTTKSKKFKSKITKYTFNKLKSKKKYYVRIRAYKTVNKKPVYGAWSSVKSIKVK